MIIDDTFLQSFDVKLIQKEVRKPTFWTLHDQTRSQSYESRFNFTNDGSIDRFQMVHSFYEFSAPQSDFYNHAMRVFGRFMIKHDITPKAILRGKCNMTTRYQTAHQTAPPHVDYLYDHKVFLYYIDDSDGETVIYNERYDEENPHNPITLTVAEKVSPKAGRAILFDGLDIHTSEFPYINDFRMVINIPFL